MRRKLWVLAMSIFVGAMGMAPRTAKAADLCPHTQCCTWADCDQLCTICYHGPQDGACDGLCD